jgi:MFS transporter, DHA3 family, macrolide efflux protein
MTSATSTLGFRDVLRTPAVKRLWIAQLVSVFGDFLAIFAIFSVVTFELHGTPMQVAMVLVSFLAPLAVISPLAGVYVDQWNVKWTMIASDVIRALMVLVLVFVRDLNVIYATLFAMATVSAFFVPAQAVAIRTLAPPGGLLTVNALMTQAIQGAQVITPSITGVLVDTIGARSCFIFDAVSFFISAGLVFTLTIKRESSAAVPAAGRVWTSLRDGMRFIFTHPAISFVMISMACGMFGVRCFGALLSVWVRDVLVSSAKLFGFLNTLIGIGMIVGSQMVRKLAARIMPERLVSYALAGMGAAVAVTAIFSEIVSTVAGMLALGFFAAFIMITSQTLMQHETPPELLGRVSSTMMSLMAISQVLSMFVAGPIAEMAGLHNLYYGSAVLLVCVAAAGLWQLRRRTPAVASPGI